MCAFLLLALQIRRLLPQLLLELTRGKLSFSWATWCTSAKVAACTRLLTTPSTILCLGMLVVVVVLVVEMEVEQATFVSVATRHCITAKAANSCLKLQTAPISASFLPCLRDIDIVRWKRTSECRAVRVGYILSNKPVL